MDERTPSKPSRRPVGAFAMRRDLPDQLFGAGELSRLQTALDLDPTGVISDLGEESAERLASIEVLVTGWGAPRMGIEQLDAMPSLRAIVHAAGTVKDHLTSEAWERGILVTNAAAANAYPVAEYTLAMILLAGKGVIDLAIDYANDPASYQRTTSADVGNYQRTIGIIGASRVGRRLIALLEPFDFEVLLYDPRLLDGDPVLTSATAVPLDEIFARSSIVSVHAPLLPETRGMIGAAQLTLLAPGSTFINTARAPIVDQDALVAAVRDRGLRAILDVSSPEPLPAEHPLRSLPGVVLTPHVAGALGNELRRLGESAVRDVERYVAGLPAEHPVTKDALVAMA